MKGQYFIIAAVILALGIAVLVTSSYKITADISPSDKNTFSNVKADFGKVLNVILKENDTTLNVEEDMTDYLVFLEDYSQKHAINLTGYFIIGLPYKQKTNKFVNITVGNFKKETINNFQIVVDGTSNTISTLENNNITSINYALTNNYFEVEYNFSGLGETISFNTSRRVFEVYELKMDVNQQTWKDRVIKTG